MSRSPSPDSVTWRDRQPHMEQIVERLSNLQNHTTESPTPRTGLNAITSIGCAEFPIDLTDEEGSGQAQDGSNRDNTTDPTCGIETDSSLAAIDLTFEEDEEDEEETLGTTSNNNRKRRADQKDEQVLHDEYHGLPNSIKKLKRRSTATSNTESKTIEVVDLTTDELEIDHENIIDLDDIVSDSDEIQIVRIRNRNQELRRLKNKRKQRVRQVRDPSKPLVSQITVNGVNVEETSCIEFQDGTFMKVCAIYPDKKHDFLLVGKMFTRITDKEIIMPRLRDSEKQWGRPTLNIAKLPRYLGAWELLNEVCQRIKIATGEADQDGELWRRSSREVKRARELIITNQSYEENCTLRRHVTALDETIIYHEGLLRCRWKETVITDEYGKVREHRLHRPSRDEVLPENFSTDAYLRSRWRGPTRNLEVTKVKPVMAEGFCGAGGMTSGALNAGMDVKIVFDHDAAKIATHDLNFPQCVSKQVDVTEWIAWTKQKALKVDVVHLSPPCQPFSPANTTPNVEKNERNQAVLLACGLAVKCLHPRVVTIEESEGLTNRHGQWFGALVSQLTELGFSVRWACLKCGDFGVPQTRTRVFLIASAPGEDLPSFPEPTQPPGSVSVQTMLDDVARHHELSPLSHHNPESLREISKPAYDSGRLAKCITCKGGDNNYHPSGQRPFTVREFLALQTFSHGFRFPETWVGRPFTRTEMMVQLGNAVPPLMGKAIMQQVFASLIATDKRRLLESGGGDEANPIEV